ncbi:hypothetical protein [Streptomyces sp. NPDC059994]|uniref:hypothetical protein n=1 Tax=Streptomyces sp. NPDC059994 TaxID=3347029 RepID=UPI00369E3CCF
MEDRITTPQRYYGRVPYFSARGVTQNTTFPIRGFALYKGKVADLTWPAARVKQNGFANNGKSFIVPEDGVYHVHFQATFYADNSRDTGNNVNVYINADGATGNGASGNLGGIIQQHIRAKEYHTTAVACTEYFTAGTMLTAQTYLDGGASGGWVIPEGEVDTGFYGFMVSPSPDGWHAATPGQPMPMQKWTDFKFISETDLNEQTYDQFNALENRARVTGRRVKFNWPGEKETGNAVAWGGIYRNSTAKGLFEADTAAPGWAANTAINIPWDGVYLVSVIGNGRHDAQPLAGVQYIYQIGIYGNGGSGATPILISQGGNARTSHESGQLINDVVRLTAGTKLNVRFWGVNKATNWDSGRDEPTNGTRWWNFAVTYLGRGNYGNG